MDTDIEIWKKGVFGLSKVFQNKLKVIISSNFYDNIIMFCVFFNTLILALDGSVDSHGEYLLT